jgi:peptidoglycan L-alanyl-D-glutamate endopeptidase CwlK
MTKAARNQAFVSMAQTRMAAQGYYAPPLRVDGDAGPGTIRAFEALVEAAPRALQNAKSAPPVEAPRAPGVGVFNEPSLALLERVQLPLRSVMIAARREIVFDVIEGLRTIERQRELVSQGASRTMNSRHLTGHAVDVWPIDPVTQRRVHHADSKERDRLLWVHLRRVAEVVKRTARDLGVHIDWGGDWGWDAPHFELNRASYPA